MRLRNPSPVLPIILADKNIQESPKTSQEFSSQEFLGAICHELKTPISAIMSFAELLGEDLCDPARFMECLENVRDIKETAAEMLELVNDLLDVQKFESENFTVNLNKAIDLKDVLRRAIKLNYDYSLTRNITITHEIIGDVGGVKLDARRMKQILTNLISNAIKYSLANTEVKITIKKTLQNLEITVLDQGFGMNDEQLKIAFLKYTTIANQNSGSVDSFGLGLAIVKHLVELQNGEILAKSAPNKGTEIRLLFKLDENELHHHR